MSNVAYFKNDGPELLETNYWDLEHAKKGYLHLSINAGCFRLLLPKAAGVSEEEMKSCSVVLVTRGPWPSEGKLDALEILFEDYSESPFMIHLSSQQCERMPLDSDRDRPGQNPKWMFALYNEEGKVFECPARYRKAKRIPYMKAWKE